MTEPSSCRNFSKITLCLEGSTPGPLSVTQIRTQPVGAGASARAGLRTHTWVVRSLGDRMPVRAVARTLRQNGRKTDVAALGLKI